MQTEIVVGVFTLGGAVIGGLFTYLSARISHNWTRAKTDSERLTKQVEGYHTLEGFYKEDMAKLDPGHRQPKTILQEMRDRVEESGCARPTMTANDARKLRDSWS